MNRITLECLNNLLQPVNMRCDNSGMLEAYLHDCTGKPEWGLLYDRECDIMHAQDLGFEIIGEGE